jgi:hypothetical protein
MWQDLATRLHYRVAQLYRFAAYGLISEDMNYFNPFLIGQGNAIIQSGAEKWENLELTMRFRPAVKFLLHVGS